VKQHIVLRILAIGLGVVVALPAAVQADAPVIADTWPDTAELTPWTVPDIAKLPNDAFGRAVRYGQELINHSTALMGPDAPDSARRYTGNGLECTNCHIKGGTARFAIPLVGIYQLYPTFSARTQTTQTLADRVNECMQRSMNGRPLPANSPELRAILAYIKFLGDGQNANQLGRGTPALPLPTRAADPAMGAAVYQRVCAACHQPNGQGVELAINGRQFEKRRYLYPPLWGPESFNDAAGMARIVTAAWFVHANMPVGITYAHPLLAADEAYDVMAFVDTQPRPHKAGMENDYPDRWLKPVGTTFPPWVGPFSEEQNRLGPWQPILDWRKANMPTGHKGPPPANDEEQSLRAAAARP
jgi:thiosulfate dehydrogenase